MVYTDPSTLEFVLNEDPLQSSKLNQATNDQFAALFPDGASGVSWTPTLEATGSDPSTSSVSGRQYRTGALQFVWVRFVLSTPGDGVYTVTLPTAASGITANATAGSGQVIGDFHARDDSTPTLLTGDVLLRTSSSVHFMAEGSFPTGAGVEHNVPFTWASGDIFSFHATYPVA